MFSKTEIVLENLEKNPRCPHGPTILFVDSVKGKKRKYFGCSAYRDKKFCDFHLDKSQKITQGKRFNWEQKERDFLRGKDHETRFQHLRTFKSSSKPEGFFCQNCEVVCDPGEAHKTHSLTKFSRAELKHPSKLIEAKSANKKEAQYFFTPESTRFLIDCLSKTGMTHVLCLGTPSLFDSLPANFNRLLLDIDSRYLGLLSPAEFCWFNMMNSHFLDGSASRSVFSAFLQSASLQSSASSLAIVLDPPFGGRPELILNTLDNIGREFKRTAKSSGPPKTVWIFPYFLERKLKELNGKLAMSEYRVEYTNHKEFSGDKGGRKQGSPVRIFTNIPLSELPLPVGGAYKMCVDCGFFVSASNRHCDECNSCTSKDGRPYVHCGRCSRCVKETYEHCALCSRCHLPTFNCQAKQGKHSAEDDDGAVGATDDAATGTQTNQSQKSGGAEGNKSQQSGGKRKHKSGKKNGKKRRKFY